MHRGRDILFDPCPLIMSQSISMVCAMILFISLQRFLCKWNESGFRPTLCTYRLNWTRRTSWGWWDEWDDTVLQTQDLKFEPWRSEAEDATSRSRRLPIILSFTRGWGSDIFFFFKPPRPGTESRTLAWKAAVLTTELTLAQYWVTVSCLAPRWMWASVTDGGPTLTQPWLKACARTVSMQVPAAWSTD